MCGSWPSSTSNDHQFAIWTKKNWTLVYTTQYTQLAQVSMAGSSDIVPSDPCLLILMPLYIHIHIYTSMFRLRELPDTTKIDFCKAQISTHPKEACSNLFSYSMSRPDLLQRRSSNCLTCLHCFSDKYFTCCCIQSFSASSSRSTQ